MAGASSRSLGSFRRVAFAGLATVGMVGCGPVGESPMVVATTWPLAIRSDLETAYRREVGGSGAIDWVVLGPVDRMAWVLNRRGGVDLLLGGPVPEYARLADSGRLVRVSPTDPVPWREARRPVDPPSAGDEGPRGSGDPRSDPSAFGSAKAALDDEGWAAGYGHLVRRASRARPSAGRSGVAGGREGVAVTGGDRARRFLAWLEGRGMVAPATPGAAVEATADGLLADLLGAALVDSHEELREADLALGRSDRPAEAEAALGERPPWPPASILRLRAGPSGGPMLDALAEQIAPDPDVRAWLRESWSRPGRPVDGGLLRELAGAVDGRLAREPRLRAWLRGEWTAWTRQLYRRVARLAGGWSPT